MRRRRFLALAGLGSSGALGGCLDIEASGTSTASRTFWIAWRDFHPETDVYGREP